MSSPDRFETTLPNVPKKRKFKPRVTQACEMCRVKKSKCNQDQPCQVCKDRGFACVYGQSKPRGGSRQLKQREPSSLTGQFSREPLNSTSPESSQMNRDSAFHLHRNTSRSSSRDFGSKSASHDLPRASDWPGSHDVQTEGINSGIGERDGGPDTETVGAMNKHTSGTEFYGRSSNFALLNQLFSRARNLSSATEVPYVLPNSNHMPEDMETPISRTSPTDIDSRLPNQSPLSVVDILHDENSNLPDPGPKMPLTVAGRSQPFHSRQQTRSPNNSRTYDSGTRTNSHDETTQNLQQSGRKKINVVSNFSECFFGKPMRLEMEYVNLYFENLHYTAPILSRTTFISRCEQEIWTTSSLKRLRRDQMHFLALYNAVLAVGALTAGTDVLLSLREELGLKPGETSTSRGRKAPSSIRLSKLYFQRARQLLGDLFEVCSLESSQTLLLMSLYCQHALKAHACYMYSGMAVRTALAIGLSNEISNQSDAARLSASRTWWAIYCQDIETSCSSGRSSSLIQPGEYQVAYPEVEMSLGLDEPDVDQLQDAIITESVRLSAILHRASREIYRSSRGQTLEQKSEIVRELNNNLLGWKSNLPKWLDFDVDVFREPEWATKQKLSLQLSFYHTKMFIHRPFFASFASKNDASSMEHIKSCLDAARKTISILYDAYQHRYYFRTWWYNSIYALYASVIVLYVVLLDCANIPAPQLIVDVQKSLTVLNSMEDMDVARRCAGLISEILEIAQKYVSSRGQLNAEQGYHTNFSTGQWTAANGMPDNAANAPVNDYRSTALNYSGSADPNDMELQHNLASQGVDTTRDGLLTRLMDPGLLEGFAIGVNDTFYTNYDDNMQDIGWSVGEDLYGGCNEENLGNTGQWD